VETYSRPATDDLAARQGEPPLADAAFRAAHILIDVTLPVLAVPRPDGLLRVVLEHAMEIAGQYPQWSAVGWRVDGAPVTARVIWFAGGWAAVSDAVAEVYLSAVGMGVGPDGLSLTHLQDGVACHFDLDQPRPGVLSASSRVCHGGISNCAPADIAADRNAGLALRDPRAALAAAEECRLGASVPEIVAAGSVPCRRASGTQAHPALVRPDSRISATGRHASPAGRHTGT
jgi:hypothetical protein